MWYSIRQTPLHPSQVIGMIVRQPTCSVVLVNSIRLSLLGSSIVGMADPIRIRTTSELHLLPRDLFAQLVRNGSVVTRDLPTGARISPGISAEQKLTQTGHSGGSAPLDIPPVGTGYAQGIETEF